MIFRQTLPGSHTLKGINGSSFDAVVKLRDLGGRTVLSFYVVAGGEAAIDSVPDGTFTVEFATGNEFSPVCDFFLDGKEFTRYADQETFETKYEGDYVNKNGLEITLTPVVGGNAQTIEIDEDTFDND